jgi:ATP-dependent Lon protease
LDNGEMDILTTGKSRFIVEGVSSRKPYLVGTVRDYPLEEVEDPSIEPLATSIHTMVSQYLEIFAALGEVDLKMDSLPQEPQALAFLTAVVLHMPMKDKQDLLNIPTLPMLLRMERKILHREAQILKALIMNGIRSRNDTTPFSVN